jgi:hypothetical protein
MVMMVMMVMMMMVMMVVMMMMVMMMVMMVMMMVMMMISGRNSLFSVGGGAKPPKFPTKLSNFRQTPHLHSFRSKFKFPKIRQFSVKVGGAPPRPTKISATDDDGNDDDNDGCNDDGVTDIHTSMRMLDINLGCP